MLSPVTKVFVPAVEEVTNILPEILLTSVPFSLEEMTPSTREDFSYPTFWTRLSLLFTEMLAEGVDIESEDIGFMLKAITPFARCIV